MNETRTAALHRSRPRKHGRLWLGPVLAILGLAATCSLADSARTWSGGMQSTLDAPWIRSSQYISVRDSTRLAADIFRPVRDGAIVSRPLPVVWILHRYHRASLHGGTLRTVLDELPWLRTLLEQEYIVAAVDARGSGASFGSDQGVLAPAAVGDTYDVTEWLAVQPWSDGNIGMFGRSYMGEAQFITASTAPPHLRAIFPEMAAFDAYADLVTGGIPRVGVLSTVAALMQVLDQGYGAVPVDDDKDGTKLIEAVNDHRLNAYGLTAGLTLPFRDSKIEATQEMPWSVGSPSALVGDINRSNVPIYHLGGWYDLLAGDSLLWYANVDNPQKVLIGPWYHEDRFSWYTGTEHLRWFDYWLKGIDNGVMTEPPIVYFTVGAPPGQEWRSTRDWPPLNVQPTTYYLRAGPTGTVKSAYDGLLSLQPSAEAGARDAYNVDYNTTSGQASRWAFPATPGKPRNTDMSALDRTGLTYTSAPLPADAEITGYPLAHLWVTATAPDADFFLFLQDVDPSGVSRPISDGALRASHRAIADPPYENFGLPYHRGLQTDVAPLPPDPTELVLNLAPISYLVKAGHRVRLTITAADRDIASTPVLSPPPIVSIFRSNDYLSSVTLPIVPSR